MISHMISKDDPLKNLYVDKREVDRLKLFLCLRKYLRIDKQTGDPIFLEDYEELDDKERLIVYLLFRRAISALGHLKKEEIGIGIRDLAKSMSMDYDYTRELLGEIDCIVNDRKRGRYFIPSENLEDALKEISHEDDIYFTTDKYTKRIK